MNTVAEASRTEKRGVLFVHGVGEQRKSDTLLDFGEPLIDWLERWHRARGDTIPRVESATLSFAPVDPGEDDSPPHATLVLHGRPWVLAEAWWATSNRQPGLVTMVSWSLRHLGDIIAQLKRSTARRASRLFTGKRSQTSPSPFARFVDLLSSLMLLLFYLVAGPLGYVVLLPLMVLAQIPIPAIQNFILLRLIRPFLVINAGEFRTYLQDELQAANMHRRVAEAVRWLVERESCADVVIVAHSEGAVVSFGMLADPSYARVTDRVRKLITLGAGLNKSWLIAPSLERLCRPLPSQIHWLDIWTPYDPVPAGWLDPPRRQDTWVKVFTPSQAVIGQQKLEPRRVPYPYSDETDRSPVAELVYWPLSMEVTNEMDVLADHGAYFANEEEVLVRLAAEIDADYYRDSLFWVSDQTLTRQEARPPALRDAVRDRRERVAWLAFWRGGLALAALGLVASFWTELLSQTAALGRSFQDLATDTGPLTSFLAALLGWVRFLTDPLPFIPELLKPLFTLPGWLIGALLLVVLCLSVYRLGRTLIWDPWDRRARQHAVPSLARASGSR